MPSHEYRCPNGHVTTLDVRITEEVPGTTECICDERAARVWEAPAAIHFKGPGFYSTDVKGRLERRRRANPGDDLHKEFDDGAARIADSL